MADRVYPSFLDDNASLTDFAALYKEKILNYLKTANTLQVLLSVLPGLHLAIGNEPHTVNIDEDSMDYVQHCVCVAHA